MKKIISLISALTLALAMAAPAMAKTPEVYIDGEKLTFDVDPFIENDRTLVPLRGIFEKLGAIVSWDQDTTTVFAIRDRGEAQDSIVLQIDNPVAFVNSVATTLDVPAKVVQDRTFVPLRFVGEALNADVAWNQEEFKVVITTK